ncbi:MAG TPA: acyltransferase [Terriglobales bacterium]|jgi:peptidoglycan/LPS O-acetylase OafA/YrhL|nr:acyltransferase [Terriglobales bacterium]
MNSVGEASPERSAVEPRSPHIATGDVPIGKTRPLELQSIQALRALAATTVIFAHVPFISRGGFGVNIFFVISGFIICYISSLNPSHFWLKRIFRIVPLYWMGTLGVFLIALIAPRLLNSTTSRPDELLKSLFFIPFVKESGRMAPVLFLGWTLEYEMFFYLVFAAALAINKKMAGWIAILALALVAAAGHIAHPRSTFLSFYLDPIIMEFALGILAFYAWKSWRPRLARVPLILAVLVSLGCYTFFFWIDRGIPPSIHFMKIIPGFLFQGGLGFIILMAFLSMEGKIAFPRWVLAVGDASYSLYLFHPYVVQLVSKKIVPFTVLTPMAVVALIGTVGLCCLFAIASFKLFERPSNEFLRRTFLPSPKRIA